MKKQIIASALCAAMCLTAAPISAFAAVSPDLSDNIGIESNVGDSSADYVVDDHEYENADKNGVINKITFYKSGSNKGTLEYQGYGVFDIGPMLNIIDSPLEVTKIVVKNDPHSIHKFTEIKGFLNTLDNVEEIVLPDTVEIIHGTAFNHFSGRKLKKVNMPLFLKKVGNCAFYGTNIESITFQSDFETTGSSICAECKNLKSARFPSSVTKVTNSFFQRAGLYDFDFSSIQDIEANAFYGCKFTELKLDSVKTIGKNAFEDNDLLKTVVLSDKIESIDENAFRSCDSLYSITIKSKNCKIAEYNNTLCAPASKSSNGTLIKCYYNSTAHKYAMKYGYHFELLDKPEGLLYGDANMDGAVTWSDVMAVLQYVANEDKYPLTAMGKINADCYNVGDGITGNDANAITDYLTEGINWLPKPAMN